MDCHIHTKCSDGLSKAEDIVSKCRELQYDCFSITDHDTITNLRRFENSDVKNIIFGTEVTAVYMGEEIHILAYFSKVPSDDFELFLKDNRIKSSILINRYKNKNKSFAVNTVKEVTKIIKDNGGISIIAHPFNYWKKIDDIIDCCDGMELIYPSFNKKDIEEIIEKYGGRCRFFTAGSDFHGKDYVGNKYINKCCEKYKDFLDPFYNYFITCRM